MFIVEANYTKHEGGFSTSAGHYYGPFATSDEAEAFMGKLLLAARQAFFPLEYRNLTAYPLVDPAEWSKP